MRYIVLFEVMANGMERRLYDAVDRGDVAEVQLLLKDNPDLNVNWEVVSQWTVLHSAAVCGYFEIVKILLAHPQINVNVQNRSGYTPFSFSCQLNCLSVVQLMLKDPRVDITLSDHRGHTPLWHASFEGSVDAVEWLIASGRELGDLSIVSSSYLHEDIALLLEKFMVNPAQIRHELQVKLGVLYECAAEIFALTVFL